MADFARLQDARLATDPASDISGTSTSHRCVTETTLSLGAVMQVGYRQIFEITNEFVRIRFCGGIRGSGRADGRARSPEKTLGEL
jgi:hypothetical protein